MVKPTPWALLLVDHVPGLESTTVYVPAGTTPVATVTASPAMRFDSWTWREISAIELDSSSEAAAAERKHSPDELHGMVEDMITLLEGVVQPELRKGRYPDKKVARRVSEGVRAVASELDA